MIGTKVVLCIKDIFDVKKALEEVVCRDLTKIFGELV